MTDPRTRDPRFRTSSRCAQSACVGVAALDDGAIAVRDTKAADGPVLIFTADEWEAFLAGVALGEFAPAALRERARG